MWIGLADAISGAAIINGQFSTPYANYGGGWYDVLIGSNSWLYAQAQGYNQGSAYTDSYDSLRLYLFRPSSGGGGGKK
jgi:hypothetical protein